MPNKWLLYWSKRFRSIAHLNIKLHIVHPHSPLVTLYLIYRLVDKLYNLSRISSKHADEAKKEYFKLVSSTQNKHKDAFLSCDEKKSRLDSFFVDLMDGNARYRKCWTFFKIVFTLSHGPAGVRRGFSVNKELLVENLQQTSLISQRLICDYISDFSKPISEIPLTNEMLKSCRLAHLRYIAALKKKRNAMVSQEKSLKWKLKHEEIAEEKKKRRGKRRGKEKSP